MVDKTIQSKSLLRYLTLSDSEIKSTIKEYPFYSLPRIALFLSTGKGKEELKLYVYDMTLIDEWRSHVKKEGKESLISQIQDSITNKDEENVESIELPISKQENKNHTTESDERSKPEIIKEKPEPKKTKKTKSKKAQDIKTEVEADKDVDIIFDMEAKQESKIEVFDLTVSDNKTSDTIEPVKRKTKKKTVKSNKATSKKSKVETIKPLRKTKTTKQTDKKKLEKPTKKEPKRPTPKKTEVTSKKGSKKIKATKKELVKPAKKESKKIEPTEENKQEPKDFFSWLNSPQKKESEVKKKVNKSTNNSIVIDNELESLLEDDYIKKAKSNNKQKTVILSENETDEIKTTKIYSENLAKLYEEQGLIEKAKSVYKKLIEQNPEKSTYFADRLNKLK